MQSGWLCPQEGSIPLHIYLAGDAAVGQKTSIKLRNAGEPSPAASVKYKAEQAGGKPLGQKGEEVKKLREYG